jgi:ELWxxDGT repeat protein
LEHRLTPSLTPQMVLDINPNAGSSYPAGMVAVGPTVYFAADDGVHGQELWRSDGTAAGTTLVRDIYPGGFTSYYGGYYPNASAPGNLTNVNGTLFFSAYDATGWNLWKSDGTAAGTVRLHAFGLSPGNFTNVNGTLFFSADDGASGTELWKSNGTAAGTSIVKDIYPGTTRYYDYYGGPWDVPNSSSPNNLTALNGTLYFTANDSTGGPALWRSDGTESGTSRIGPGSATYDLTTLNGTLFFAASDGAHGSELWKSDGTLSGTVPVKDIRPDGGSYPTSLANVNGTLFFSADDGVNGRELWKSDGTATGTTLVKDIYPGGSLSYYGNYYVNSSSPTNLTNVNGTLYFSAYDAANGWELWKSDGTAGGTALVKDIAAGTVDSLPSDLTNVNGTLFFSAYDGSGSWKLWRSDGSAAGTMAVTKVAPTALTNVNGTLCFSVDDGPHGRELWKLVDDPNPATNLQVSGFPGTVKAGAGGTITVTVKNADGSTNTGYTGTVHFTSSDPRADLPADYTFAAADHGVHAFTVILKTAGSQSVTTEDTVVPLGTGTQAGITVNPAAASHFALAGLAGPVTAGTATSLTVTALDAFDNRATGYTGTVRFTSGDGQAVLPGDYTFAAADAGVHTFSVVLKTAGTQSLTVTDTASAAIGGTQYVTVTPGKASRLVVTAPSSVKRGARFSLTVMVTDDFGNVVPDYRGTITFRSSDRTAKVPRNYTFTSGDQGVHTFTGLVLKKKGRQTVTLADARDGSLTAGVVIEVR